MNPLNLEPQPGVEELDETTHAALDQAEAEAERGEIFTLLIRGVGIRQILADER